MIVTGVLEAWYDPTRPVFTHVEEVDLGKRRKVGRDSRIRVECRNERIANDIVSILRTLGYIDVEIT